MTQEIDDLEFIKNFETYRAVLNNLNLYGQTNVYTFIEKNEYIQTLKIDIALGNKIYVQELLYRAHMAAITTILRNAKWMAGLSTDDIKPNYFIFSACLRGLIESAADSAYCLNYVPKTLAMNFKNISEALCRKVTKGIIHFPEFEDLLIHYSHGAKQTKHSNVPETHKAKTTKEYLEILEEGDSKYVSNLYSELCQITHPAARTVAIFTMRQDPRSNQYNLITHGLDMDLIADLIVRHNEAFTNIFQLSFNTAFLALAILNKFQVPEIYTKSIGEGLPDFIKSSFGMILDVFSYNLKDCTPFSM